MEFVVRTKVSYAAAIGSMNRAILEVDPSSSIVFQDMQTQIRESLLLDRLMAMLSGFFGFLAALIAMIGLYGVISYSVARRTHEIGIRVALGANRTRVIKLILARTARSLLFGLQPHDPLTISLAVVALALVGLAASYLPALRAAHVDPMVALRDE
jgi:ABC-type antimicrobial peptide transport system permease subunit